MDDYFFISYKSEDREAIQPYLGMLEKDNIKYWYDQNNITNQWGLDIDSALKECKGVICFLSERTYQSSAVHAEICECREKLHVVRLDNSIIPYSYKSVVSLLSHYSFFDVKSPSYENQKNRFISNICKGGGLVNSAHNNTVSKKISVDNIPFILALCFFEYQSVDVFMTKALEIQDMLIQMLPEDSIELDYELKLDSILKEINAEVVTFKSQLSGLTSTYIRFSESSDCEFYISEIWNNQIYFKKLFLKWIATYTSKKWIPRQIAEGLALLSQKNFLSIQHNYLNNWLTDNRLKYYADFIIAEAGQYNPEIIIHMANTINLKTNISSEESDGQESNNQFMPKERDIETSLFLACGLTGLRMPTMAINLFKNIQNILDESDRRNKEEELQEKVELVNKVIKNVDDLFENSLSKERNTCYSDISNFLLTFNNNLKVKVIKNNQKLPSLDLILALIFLGKFHLLSDNNSNLNLMEMIKNNNDGSIIEATAKILDFAISDSSTDSFARDKSSNIINSWCEDFNKNRDDKSASISKVALDEAHKILKDIETLLQHADSKKEAAYIYKNHL